MQGPCFGSLLAGYCAAIAASIVTEICLCANRLPVIPCTCGWRNTTGPPFVVIACYRNLALNIPRGGRQSAPLFTEDDGPQKNFDVEVDWIRVSHAASHA